LQSLSKNCENKFFEQVKRMKIRVKQSEILAFSALQVKRDFTKVPIMVIQAELPEFSLVVLIPFKK